MFGSKSRNQKIADAQEVHNRNLREAKEHREGVEKRQAEFKRRYRIGTPDAWVFDNNGPTPEYQQRYAAEARRRVKEEQERLDNAARESGQALAEARRRWRI